jgi:hypothetical protein
VSKETLLDALTLDFRNIARAARAIELSEPGFSAPYRLPSDSTEAAITTHADKLIALLADRPGETDAARAALRAKFIPYKMSADFVEDLRVDREAIRSLVQHSQGEVQSVVEQYQSDRRTARRRCPRSARAQRRDE